MTYNIGDKVRIVNYGSIVYAAGNLIPKLQGRWPSLGHPEGLPAHAMFDISPDLVGQEGIVAKAVLTQGIPGYALEGPSKHAWYNEDQLELVTKNNVFA